MERRDAGERSVSQALIEALRQGRGFDHPVSRIEVYETHVSWVILTGDYAYKIKKPLDFGSFLDFSTLEKRRRLCEQEVRLNRRLAPALYLDTVAITGTPEAPSLGGSGTPFEYAVKMRQFSNRHLFSTLQASGELSEELLDDLVAQLVAFHEEAPRVSGDSQLGSPDTVRRTLDREFRLIEARLVGQEERERLSRLETWSLDSFARLEHEFERRWREGYVRETHGDIHLGNAVHFEGRALLFDGLEFNAELRWNDVGCELAFLLMDLEARGEQAYANHVLNRYLELSGDYELVRLLAYYKLYRALVRVKVALLHYHQEQLTPEEREAVLADYHCYMALAERYSEFRFPYLVVGVGVSGSGKSRFTGEMVRRLGGVRVRSDIERKRLYGFEAQADTRAGGDIYTPQASERTYARLAELAGILLESGLPACVDATCLTRAQRAQLCFEAERRGLAVLMVSFEADTQTLRARIEKRAQRGGDPSEAGLEVLERQLARFEPFADDELSHLVHLDTTAPDANLTLVSMIQERIQLR
ncbi:bifunctional aminoglycoside phosphotransferase/ATP-binding protein [Chromohalobacter israelensis]|uniref:bifunctional aminoglycoside phosphotransferase/ATP-binding protein n=1 Tax=Chromohalobacter israelensis TaxID=141390 RepID=UPI00055592A0|nr:bifunctional aminoglycoside phosphotransferase/ATP-binding protein [Chromohalobacter israelensis]MDF9433890.1 AAA family ATPase [Chromohalobacter israelensis]